MTSNKKIHQIILLDKEGNMIYSCDSIYKASKHIGQNIIKQTPFLESIFHKLVELNSTSPVIRFSRLEDPMPELNGAYDFTFSNMQTKEGEFILWSIYDYSYLYKNIKNSQQKRQEQEMLREKLINKRSSTPSKGS